jgi:tRNA U38,U39,U40 pseudouridine synthase TruA
MQSIYDYLISSTKTEHDLEHDSRILSQFSTPKIYTAKGDLTKRWYVYFYIRNPKTGKLDRMENVYGKVNHYKKKESRMRILSSYRKNLFLLLKQGFNPLADNSELYQPLKTPVIEKEIEETPKEEVISTKTINEALKIAVKEALDENTVTSLVQNVLVTRKLIKKTKSTIENTQKTIP